MLKDTVKHDTKINVWGALVLMALIFRVKGIMYAKDYHQILIHHLKSSAKKFFGNNNFVFQ